MLRSYFMDGCNIQSLPDPNHVACGLEADPGSIHPLLPLKAIAIPLKLKGTDSAIEGGF